MFEFDYCCSLCKGNANYLIHKKKTGPKTFGSVSSLLKLINRMY